MSPPLPTPSFSCFSSLPSYLQKAPKLLFLGAPGAGKGTYASALCSSWDIPHVSTGDIIRDEVKGKTELGEEFRSYSDRGALVPDRLVVEIAKKRLSQTDAQRGYILDGFPRTRVQAETLQLFSNPSLCVNIQLPDKFLVMKLSGRRVCNVCGRNYNIADIREGEYDMPPLLPKETDCDQCHGKPDLFQRADDNEEVVSERLRTYQQDTAPLVDFYNKMGILMNFDVKKGVNDLPEITKQIIERLKN
eukprot:GHVS01031638.1.p1 GENE.GHVS01031638.1~~GHVS01031638.1.p1  ORF type:complete len:247 (+),score=22.42 GHVS01031638.1:156-896(+)